MRVSVIGCGHLGASHAAAMAELGHEVVGVEIDPDKCAILATGASWFYEAGMDDLLAKHVPTGRLRFTTSLAEAAAFADVHFLAVGTPLRADGQGYDVSQVLGAAEQLVPLLTRPATIIGKSTVTVGTVARLQQIITERAGVEGIELVWNPEFLREGHAVADSLFPDRILVGLSSPTALATVEQVYAPIMARGDIEMVVTDPATAEVAKSAANAFLATKISYINAMAQVCDLTGANIDDVAHVMGIDKRIGHGGMRAGLGYGGGCLPKDVAAFAHAVTLLGATDATGLLDAVQAVNRSRMDTAVQLVTRAVGRPLAGLTIGYLGAAFKAGTSDVRDSPALRLADRLHDLGATVRVHDPESLDNARHSHPHLAFAPTALDAVSGADLVVIATEWGQYTRDPKLPVAAADRTPARTVVDVRNALDAEPWLAAGWTVHQMGRPTRSPGA
ncbi:UDP-glucose dehydrogenase family protein [Streptomyces sp. NRRL WC-3742]|uniref:UDP-glucose dehydrogenase family protein n=1 Tax=Streptomyces sp. NRRL WC-3742 TaxID=1463934 RepID=UPI0004C5A689|nr:UDP-glucose/GDP-mannose dehydrogenase family protein [Streptomyces sp. NRRL WC-3742]